MEIAAICDVHADLLKQRGKEFGVKQCFSDYRKLLETDVDAVSVCVGNILHREVAIAALQAGKHILLEKPMAMNAAEAADIVQAAGKAGKVVQRSRVLVLGLTFKENVPDLRNSRVVDIIHELREFDVEVLVHDPLADPVEARREMGV